jgi:TatD DNase family protein
MYVDFHTHQPGNTTDTIRIRNLDPSAELHLTIDSIFDGAFISLGVHPWNVRYWNASLEGRMNELLLLKQVVLLGEIGLDRKCGIPMPLQYSVFEAQLRLAGRFSMPVVIHSVRASSDVIEARRRFPEVPAWVIHGFRGKKIEAEQLIRAGFYLSFGLVYHREAMIACPADRMFLESDDSSVLMSFLYEQAALVRSCGVLELKDQIQENLRKVLSFK